MTIPRRVQDNPTYLNYRSDSGRVLYGEDVYVGYRCYEKLDNKPLYAFGHGLSYTSFSLQDLSVQVDDNVCKVTLWVTNTGSRAGAEVIQVYVAPPSTTAVARPVKELKAFRKVRLEAGEEKHITIDMDAVLSTSYWHEGRDKWCSEKGLYDVLVGRSSADTPLQASFEVTRTSYWTGLAP